MSPCMRVRFAAVLAALALASAVSSAMAQDCLVSPTTKEVVSGRFGKFRAGGADNFGSTNTAAHMHDGIDFSTSNSQVPLYSVTQGTVLFVGPRGSAGNALLIKRSNGDIVAYYHMSGFAQGIAKGATVTPGELVGISGNTNAGNSSVGGMAKHLHFVYGVAQEDQARAKAFPSNAALGPFNPGQLPTTFNQQSGIGWKTDPSPYFCKTYPIQDGHPEDVAILGGDTKAQYQKLFGSVPPPGGVPASSTQFDVGEVEAANQDAALSAAAGQTSGGSVTSSPGGVSGAGGILSDVSGYGSVPQAPIGDYDTMSRREMLLTEANRRFSSGDWNTSITKADSRALWVDYLKEVGVSNYLAKAIYDKRARIEALLAVYESLKMARLREQVSAAQQAAVRQSLSQQIQ
jgi:murein DD-endopeptidase